jgi:hypothetical protein
MLLLVSPLLALAGFYDPPFRIKAESSVELVLDDDEEILRGRIDVLVLQESVMGDGAGIKKNYPVGVVGSTTSQIHYLINLSPARATSLQPNSKIDATH